MQKHSQKFEKKKSEGIEKGNVERANNEPVIVAHAVIRAASENFSNVYLLSLEHWIKSFIIILVNVLRNKFYIIISVVPISHEIRHT